MFVFACHVIFHKMIMFLRGGQTEGAKLYAIIYSILKYMGRYYIGYTTLTGMITAI